jgi:hypothetical protein
VIEHGTGLLLRQAGAKLCSAFAFGEAALAGPSVKEAETILLAEAAADRKVACTASAVKRAVGVQAATAIEVVHGPEEIAGQ